MISTTDAATSRPNPPDGGAAPDRPRHPHRNAEGEVADEDDDEKEEEGEKDHEEHGVGSQEESPHDCFFESSVVEESDEEEEEEEDDDLDDGIRFSFASAVGPPSDFRCVTFSREQFLAELHDDIDEEEGTSQPGRSSEYDIWMAEPTSVDERRRRLLNGMGFASSKDLADVLRTLSRKASVIGPAATVAAADVSESEPPPAASALSRHTTISRCCSNKELATTRRSPKDPAEPDLRRSNSAPAAPRNLPDMQKGAPPDGAGATAAEQGKCLVVSDVAGLRIKNLDTGKELVVSNFAKGGDRELSDIRNGNQISMEELQMVIGHSPIVKDLIQVANLVDGCEQQRRNRKTILSFGMSKGSKSVSKKKGGWLKNFMSVAGSVTSRTTEKDTDKEKEKEKEKDTEKEKEKDKGENSSSGDGLSELMKVRQHGKSNKDLTGLYITQEIHAHEGSIWCMEFSWDGQYLASAGEDRVIRVWQTQESDALSAPMRGQEDGNLSKSRSSSSSDRFPLLKTLPSRRSKKSKNSKRSLSDHIVMPEFTFSLSKNSICSLEGHSGDVLDLSWSKSQHLLSSSMDKTVRLWDIESETCLKLFAHNDFVTSIQFNPVDDNYFISGSLDFKARIWSIPEHHVADWSDLREMITAASYTPDGQGVLVGSHKGNFRLYDTSDCKLTQRSLIQLKKKKKPHSKKITGFQFAPDNPSEVLITSADSRIRVFDGLNLVHKFRAFRNTSSQISASYTADGRFVVCASEDSHVYVWKREPAASTASSGNKGPGWTTTRAHECFYCKDVSVAIPWPSAGSSCAPLCMPDLSGRFDQQGSSRFTDSRRSAVSIDDLFQSKRSTLPPLPKKSFTERELPEEELKDIGGDSGSAVGSDSDASGSASLRCTGATPSSVPDSDALASLSISSSGRTTSSADSSGAWGLVVVTASMDGNIKVYQNFGLPLRLNLF